jgi:hypothetical protein
MGKFGNSRRSTAQPTTHDSTRRPRGDGRLDPVRWRRPGRGTLLRLVAVAALLATAAAVSWSPPRSCDAPPSGRVAPTAATGTSEPPSPEPGSSVGQARAAPAVPEGAVPDGSVGVPIRLADPTALSLVRPGNRVDLLRIEDAGGHPTAVAAAALVLRVTDTDDPTASGLLLALTPQEARQAVITSRQGFAIVIRPG